MLFDTTVSRLLFRSIEKLGDFSSIGLKNVLTNRYAVRQLIAQEVQQHDENEVAWYLTFVWHGNNPLTQFVVLHGYSLIDRT